MYFSRALGLSLGLLAAAPAVARPLIVSDVPPNRPIGAAAPDSARGRGLIRTLKAGAVPVLFVAYGGLTIGRNRAMGMVSNEDTQAEIREHYPRFRTRVDDFMQVTPVLAVATLDLCGVKGAHAPLGQATRLTASLGLVATVVTVLKYTIREERPDGSARNSFPSGHTATTFATAEFLHQEFRDHPALVIGGYTVATGVGVCRMLNNKHWLSDVFAGAGIGMLSTKLAYWGVNRFTTRAATRPASRLRLTVAPGYVPGGGGSVALVMGW